MNKKILKPVLTAFAVIACLFAATAPVLAFSIINNADPYYSTGDYNLTDVENIGIEVAGYILSIVGTLSLVMFVYGGIMFLISGGSADKVKKGKDAIIAAVIGLVITFSAVLIVKMFLGGLGITWSPNSNNGAIPASNSTSTKAK